MCAMLRAAFVFGGLAVMLGVGPPPATLPAAEGSGDADLEECMQHCRITFTAIEHTLRLLDRAQDSDGADQMRDALGKARTQLIEMRKQMRSSMIGLERLRNGSYRQEHATTAARGHYWVCPMHTQVRQDRPGNCPICDVTLRSVPAGTSSTQPALAVLPTLEYGPAAEHLQRSSAAK